MNYDEHVECWNVYVCFRCILMNYASLYDGLCILLCIMFKFLISAFILVPGYGTVFMSVNVHGAVFPDVLVFGHVLFVDRRVGDVTKFSRPSNLSSSLVLGVILSSKSLKNEIYQNRILNLPVDVLGGGELVDPTSFYRSLIFSLQILLAKLQHCSFSSFVLLHFFWFTAKQGFGFLGDLETQKIQSMD